MTYEEKLNEMRTKGTISMNLLDPIDFFRFIRDGAMKVIRYRNMSHGESIYEVHCSYLGLYPWEDIVPVDNCKSIDEFNKFMLNIFETNLTGYMELEGRYYKIELDVL